MKVDSNENCGRAPARGRPPDPRKYAAVLDAARVLFKEQGFRDTSMDAIARAAGVSKLTVYNHFGNKGGLFARVIEIKCEEMLGGIEADVPDAASASEILNRIGNRFLTMVLDDEALSVHRMITEERDRSPELGGLFMESAILNSTRRVGRVLAILQDRGELRIEDPVRAARDLMMLWRAEPMALRELGIGEMTGIELEKHIARVTNIFLSAWHTD